MVDDLVKSCPSCGYPTHAGHAPDCKREDKSDDEILVPLYDPDDQIFDDTEKFPEEWERFRENIDDKDLFTVIVEVTRAHREMTAARGISSHGIGGQGLEWALENINHEVGGSFQAHGLAKGDPVVGLDKLLTNGVRNDQKFYSMGFHVQKEAAGAFGADHPFTTGGLIVVSEQGKDFTTGQIKYVIVGEEYRRVVDLLRKKYPKVKIVPWHDAPSVLTAEYNKYTGEARELPLLKSKNAPFYAKIDNLSRSSYDESIVTPEIDGANSNDIDVW